MFSDFCDEDEWIECEVVVSVPREDSDRGYLWKALARIFHRNCEVVGVIETARVRLPVDLLPVITQEDAQNKVRSELRAQGIRLNHIVSVRPTQFEAGFFRP